MDHMVKNVKELPFKCVPLCQNQLLNYSIKNYQLILSTTLLHRKKAKIAIISHRINKNFKQIF